MAVYISHSAEETQALGMKLGRDLPPNSVVCFFGDLGAGKTTFIKGLVAGSKSGPESHVTSPTFTYLNIYQETTTVYHFDLYRLRDADEFLSMGFDETFYAGGICCIEWSEKIERLLPSDVLRVNIEHIGEGSRRISIQS